MPKSEATIARPGATYRHFKGGVFTVIAIATDADTGESFVIYTPADTSDTAAGVTWARTRTRFEDGRFQRINPEPRA